MLGNKTLLCFGLLFFTSMATPVLAQIPEAVLAPYKAYNKALDAGDIQQARKTSYDAWQNAEELLGDTKTRTYVAKQTLASVI